MVVYFSNDKGLCYEMVSDDHIYRNHWPGIFTKDDRFIFIFLDMVTRQYFTDKSTNHGMYIQTCNNLCMNNDMQVFSESVKTTIPDVDSDNKRAVSNCYDDEICNYVAHKIASLIVLYCMCKRSPRYKR